MRYMLQPAGGAAYSSFYLYVSHAKSGTDSTSIARRGVEATTIRNNAATLKDFDNNPDAHVIYTGDWNLGGSSDGGIPEFGCRQPDA